MFVSDQGPLFNGWMNTFTVHAGLAALRIALKKKVKWKIDKEIYNLSSLSYLFWLFLNQLWAGDKDIEKMHLKQYLRAAAFANRLYCCFPAAKAQQQ